MANVRFAMATRNAMLEAVRGALDAGTGPAKARIYSGPQPGTANTALSGNTQLAELPLSDPCAPPPSGGVLALSAISQDPSADSSGIASFARIVDASGNAIFDCDVGTAGATITLNTTTVVAGLPVRITSFAFEIAAS